MDPINDILNKLSEEDIASLQAMADAVFGNPQEQYEPAGGEAHRADFFSGIDPGMLEKLSRMMGAMGQKDRRSDLILALKPYLSAERRKRADEALQLVRLMELLPLLQENRGNL